MKLEPGQTLKQYKLLRSVGSGGMGEVYLAEDSKLKRRVAIKFLTKLDSGDSMNRFLQEAQAASALNHPNIITVHDFDEDQGYKYLVTEFIEGQSLRQVLNESKLSAAEAVRIVLEIAKALIVAHSAGIIHRDVKPENVMIRKDGLVKVLDFGLAKISSVGLEEGSSEADTVKIVNTNPGVILGTIGYMSPEQAKGKKLDGRTDIWSLGVVLFELLTGHPPFVGETASELLASILKDQPKRLEDFSSSYPEQLQRVLDRTLQKSFDLRYSNIDQFSNELSRCDLSDIRFSGQVQARKSATKSVAILPFRNLTNDSAVSFYEFSLADAVITELARTSSLTVSPSAVVARYLGQDLDPINEGRELCVDYVVVSNFIASGDKLRVSSQLIDVSRGSIVWVERIDLSLEDLIVLQDKISQKIVEGVKVELSDSEEREIGTKVTENETAYLEYLKGRDALRKYIYQTVSETDIEDATEHFASATRLDPEFGLAYCGLGSCHMHRIFKGRGRSDDLQTAIRNLERGLALDPNNAEARSLKSLALMYAGHKDEALKELSRLLEDSPTNAHTHFCSAVINRHLGHYKEAMEAWDKMLAVDPTCKVIALVNKGRLCLYQGRYEEALEELSTALSIDPNHPIVRVFYAVGRLRAGNAKEALILLEALLDDEPIDAFRPFLAMCYSSLGERDKASSQLTADVLKVASTDSDISYWLASAFAMESKNEEAFFWMRRSIEMGNYNVPWFKTNPSWNKLKDEPEFEELIDLARSN